MHRASVVCSDDETHKKEMNHVHNVLSKCGYPNWALQKVKFQITKKRIEVPNNPPVRIRPQMKTHVVVPYVSGLSESYSRVMEKNGIKIYFKGHNTIRNMLVAPKDPDSKLNTR